MTATITNRPRPGQSARSRQQSPAFYFYAKDWRSSRNVQNMSYGERGMFLEMLIEQWLEGAAPGSPDACATRFGGAPAAWKNAWEKLENCFVRRKRDGLLINLKMKRIRQDREAFLKSQRESGLRGAQKLWAAHGKPMASPSNPDGDPNGLAMGSHGHRSRSGSLSGSGSEREEKEVVRASDVRTRRNPRALSPITQSALKAFREARKS